MNLEFYKGKRVFITGHTGFKGSWMCKVLIHAGAQVTGYALEPPTTPALFELAGLAKQMRSVIGDIRDYETLKKAFDEVQPEIVIHMAAQPIVRESYKNPVYTYETNVMGTVNILECIRTTNCVKSFLNVTTDKVYKNKEVNRGYTEDEELEGFDPYSNSKSCSEIITHSYKNSFFSEASGREIAISTARAGNVIGGGDFAADRIIPDCIRAMEKGQDIVVRNPHSIRPFQHVLEPVMVYLMIAQKQYEDKNYAGYYNVGPDECDCITTGELTDLFCKYWGNGVKWVNISEENAPHEATYLKLDCQKLKKTFEWCPKWHIEEVIKLTCEFYKVWLTNGDISEEMDREIHKFLEG